jgi:hypothetical protein
MENIFSFNDFVRLTPRPGGVFWRNLAAAAAAPKWSAHRDERLFY